MAGHRRRFGVAPVPQQQAGPAPPIGGDQAKHAFALVVFAGLVPGHRAAPAHPAAPHQAGGILAMELGNRRQAGIVEQQLLHHDQGTAGLGTAVQQVVATALGTPAPAAQLEKAEGIVDHQTACVQGAAGEGAAGDRLRAAQGNDSDPLIFSMRRSAWRWAQTTSSASSRPRGPAGSGSVGWLA